jgi:hypothetical protein
MKKSTKDKNRFITFRINEDSYDRISQIADEELLNVSDICRRGVMKYVKHLEEEYAISKDTS